MVEEFLKDCFDVVVGFYHEVGERMWVEDAIAKTKGRVMCNVGEELITEGDSLERTRGGMDCFCT